MAEIVKTRSLYRDYPRNRDMGKGHSDMFQVLRGIDFRVDEGEFVGIMGKSGCGKTTLIKVLGLIDKPTGGDVFFKGQDTSRLWSDELADIRRREIGFIFQDYYLMDSLSVKENIMLPMILDKKSTEQCAGSAEKLAALFEITHLMDKNPYELSGGEKQRVAICRALINNPELILADEPTGNLDSKSGAIVLDEFRKINQELGKAIIMVTHDPQIASRCSRVIFIRDGLILEELENNASQEKFYDEILRRMKEL